MRTLPRGFTRYVLACILLSALLVAGALYALHWQTATVQPYSYRTQATVNGQTLTCTMTVDSNGNGSLNNCSAS